MMSRLAAVAFVSAALLYGLFGSPTPDNPASVEFLVLSLLALAVLCGGLRRSVLDASWSKPLLLFLGYGIGIGTLSGALGGNAGGDMLRDLLGFAAFAVPLALYGVNARVLAAAMLGIGFAFAARYIASPDVLSSMLAENLLYLANSPLVPFAGGWLLLHGCFAERKIWLAVVCVAASLVPILAMAGMMQRATLLLLALVWLGFFAATVFKNPRRAFVIAAASVSVLALHWADVSGIVAALVAKTREVGWNARGAELAALLSAQSQNPLTAIFGAGWGSVFKSPAVGDQWVRFSHSLLTSLWWKTGWVGLLLGAFAITVLLRDAWRRMRHNLVLFSALVLPLIPATFLYGSYKSLCFGLLLLGLARGGWTLNSGNVNQTAHEHAGNPPVDPSGEPRLPADARGDGAFAA